MRLFALDELGAPAGVAGTARAVGSGDARRLDLLAQWRTEFDREIGRTCRHPPTARDDVVRAVGTGAGEIVWEVDGEPVAQAAARAVVAGMSRIGPVYTPPEHRGRGYAAAVTAAAARWALGSGARHVLLYTDLANPTTNRLYPRLGFRPRYDALELRFVPGQRRPG
jgi:GNAT superfamily N-acetyltransferase